MGTRPQHAPIYKKLQKLLRQQRLDAGLTQRALAARLGKPHSFVYKVEIGERRIDPVEFVLWHRACGVASKRALAALDRLVD